MKTKQAKEDLEKSIDEDTTVEPKTRARKKATDGADEDKSKAEDPKTSKEPRKNIGKPKAVVKKKPLGIRKTLRSRKPAIKKNVVKTVIKQTAVRGRKPVAATAVTIKTEPDNSQDKETVPLLIPAAEIKKEPIDDTTPNSRSSSPRTAGKRQRLTSDMAMMKSVLGDSPSTLVTGPRSPYSMRSERSNSPTVASPPAFEGKNLRSGKPRKGKASTLLNEVVIKEQNKRRRLLSDSKAPDDGNEDCKKLKRGRSCSREGSEISKCSDITESDISVSESLLDIDSKELNKKLDKTKTDLDIDIENNLQISSISKVPSLNVDSKIAETKPDTEPKPKPIFNDKTKKSLSLKRSTSLDSDNNNSNRVKLENINSSDVEDKSPLKTENDALFNARSSILNSMAKTFNSKEVSKNIRKARRGRKAAAATRSPASATAAARRSTVSSTVTSASTAIATDAIAAGDKIETLESLSKDINDLINNLDQNIDRDDSMTNDPPSTENSDQLQTKPFPKVFGASKPLGDNNSIIPPETPVKDKVALASVTADSTPSNIDDSENFKLHYEEDSNEQKTTESAKQLITYKCSPVASIDKLMDRLKEFEELDKKRQRLESESKFNDAKPVMVGNDVVLINKSGTDIKQLKDIQTVRSPERPLEKENVLSCFENNSAISIVKRDQVRKSIDIDLTNSVTLIKRNSISARKESTSSNSRDDAISIFEKSLGRDVTLTEIRKSVDKPSSPQVDLHQFATLLPNSPNQTLGGVVIDPKQISITPRVPSEIKVTNRLSRESLSRKTSESGNDLDEKISMATLEKIKSPVHKPSDANITPSPVAVKSPEATQPMEAEVLAPPLEDIKDTPDADVSMTPTTSADELAEVIKIDSSKLIETKAEVTPNEDITKVEIAKPIETKAEVTPKEDITKVDIAKPIQTKGEVSPKEDTTKVETVGKGKRKSPKSVDKVATSLTIPKVTQKDKKKIEVDEKAEVTKAPEAKPTAEKVAQEGVKVSEVAKVQDFTKLQDVMTVPEVVKLEETNQKFDEIAQSPKAVTKSPSVEIEKSKSARNSLDSEPGPSNMLHETPESQKRKESMFRTLGLLTHKAASEAKIEKAKEKERIYSGIANNKGKVTKTGSGDYTGTLKTVIKLNRGGDREKRFRSSLKMTFQKSKHRGRPQLGMGGSAAMDDAYYTIERREGAAASTSDGGHRKSYSNRLNNHDVEPPEALAEPKETLNLVIPEKASSFSIHPGRLCMDQCFYCGGKFGLFDTPCHIAQMKSSERQKKVLDNEEKLTIDSCLCDACYRHVDRRANCPSYRKRPPKALAMLTMQPNASGTNIALSSSQKPSGSLGQEQEESDEEGSFRGLEATRHTCHTAGCGRLAERAIRRKWLIKLRTPVNQLLKLEGDYPGLHTIPLCSEHYRALAPLMQCAMCKRRVTKHHNVHLPQNYEELNPLLAAALVPVRFDSRPVLCKLCRYYCSLLTRPKHNEAHAHAYTRKLLQLYNIEVPPEPEPQPEATNPGDPNNKHPKKKRNKSKQRKSSDPDKPGEESLSSEKTESSPEKDKIDNTNLQTDNQDQDVEEDIESLISSNRILVPGATKPSDQPNEPPAPDPSVYDFDAPAIPVDKQTELQYLLQKQNNPAQFLPNLTQKKTPKMPSLTGITKPAQLHRITDKNAKKIQKIGQVILHKDRQNINLNPNHSQDVEMFDPEKQREAMILKNMSLSEECTIESIPNKKPADINTLKNKWQMSESFTQVKKNLSELSKKLTIEKEPKKTPDTKYSNPVKRLETNPSISVRELFPGEEEMNLQCNVEFNNLKGITPEGWEKCSTMIQYDAETKRLWNDLQRPYGNQSSFLRHLILLEKYFRSGDLVLSHNATPHAANYSDSVQSRLRAFDNVVNETPRRSEPSISLIEYRKKPSVNSKSLLKTNFVDADKDPKSFMPPPSLPKPKSKPDKSKSKPMPPELIALNPPNGQGRKAIQNVLHNIQQLVKGVSASDPTEVAASPLPPPKFDPPPVSTMPPPLAPPPPVKDKKDTPKKSKPTSKPWRPTLMPITQENLNKIAREPTQVSVDGRHLPSLVMVMSSGKKYHITLQDYNKMCIMRREKLQQIQDAPKHTDTTVVTEVQTSAMLGNGGTMVQNIPAEKETEKKEATELQISSNAATILKNVGLKNITIAAIPQKTATVTSMSSPSSVMSSPSLLVTTPIKLPNLGPAVSITSETVITPTSVNMNSPISTHMIMPKIPKSLTVIPQTVVSGATQNIIPHSVVMSHGIIPSTMLVPQAVSMPSGMVIPQMPHVVVPSTSAQLVSTESTRP